MSVNTLVVGADGQIGGALFARLSSLGRPVLGTSRRPDSAKGLLHLDLADEPTRWRLPEDVSVAFLCAAITALRECEADPAGTARVNVEHTASLASMLVGRGAFVVFLSSNLVFDGSEPYRRSDAPTCPETEYGRQKAAAERAILAPGGVSIVRLTKVLSPGDPLLGDWITRLRRGEEVQPFRDKVMAPVGLRRAVEVLIRAAEAKAGGILQVSADRDLSYAEVAEFLCRRLGVEPSLVRPRDASSAGLPPSASPRATTLCTRRMAEELGIRAPDPTEALEELLER